MLKQIKIDRTFIILTILIVVLIGFIIGFRQNIVSLFTGEKSQTVTTKTTGPGKNTQQLAINNKEGLLAKALQNATGPGTFINGNPSEAGRTNPTDPLSAVDANGNPTGNAAPNGKGVPDNVTQDANTAGAGSQSASCITVADLQNLRNPFQNFFKKVIPYGQNPNQGYAGNGSTMPNQSNSNISYQNLTGQHTASPTWGYPVNNQNPVTNSGSNTQKSNANNNQNSNANAGTNHNTNSNQNQNGSPQTGSGKLPEPVLVKPEIIYPPFELKGIVTLGTQEKALIASKNQSQIVNKGDSLQNWSVADIDKDKVILTNQEGQRFILTLEGVTLDESKSEGKNDGKANDKNNGKNDDKNDAKK